MIARIEMNKPNHQTNSTLLSALKIGWWLCFIFPIAVVSFYVVSDSFFFGYLLVPVKRYAALKWSSAFLFFLALFSPWLSLLLCDACIRLKRRRSPDALAMLSGMFLVVAVQIGLGLALLYALAMTKLVCRGCW